MESGNGAGRTGDELECFSVSKTGDPKQVGKVKEEREEETSAGLSNHY